MKKGIFAKFTLKKGDKSDQSPTASSISASYRTFNDICNVVGSNSGEGAKILHVIITDITLFHRYITTPDKLKTLVTMAPLKIDDILQILKTDPDSEQTFLTGVDILVDTNAFFKARKGQQYQDDLIKHALANKQIYTNLLTSENQLQIAFRLLPQFQEQILEILVNDIAIFCRCVGRLPFFCEFVKKHENHRNQFIKLVYTSERVFKELRLFDKHEFAELVQSFPEVEEPLLDYICANREHFIAAFGTFDSIYEFCKKPQFAKYLEKLFARASSMDDYVRRNITSINRLIEVYNYNPAHAEQLESMILADPKWVYSMVPYSEDIQTLANHKAFGRLKQAYFTIFYSDSNKFDDFVSTEAELQEMISIVPDQEFKLRLYYQLHIKKKPVTEIIKTQYQDPAKMLELKQHLQNGIKIGSITPDILKAVRDQINAILDFTEDTAPYFSALNELKVCVDYNLTPTVAALLHKDTLKAQASAKEKGDTTQLAQPDSPDRLSNN